MAVPVLWKQPVLLIRCLSYLLLEPISDLKSSLHRTVYSLVYTI